MKLRKKRLRGQSNSAQVETRLPSASTLFDGTVRIAGRGLALALAASLAIVVHASPSAAERIDYKLGPQDKIRVRIVEWRASIGESFEWTALNGEYTVNSEGNLSLPLIGEVEATGLATQELSRTLASRLQERVGLVQKPDASVEIIQHRPYYITGVVERPGEYFYRPGMNVVQAISIAGGMRRSQDPGAARLEREAISSRGELRVLDQERIAMSARIARLEAELKGAEKIAFPKEITDNANIPGMAQVMREETAIFEARREGLAKQAESLRALRVLLLDEIKNQTAKIETETVQLELIQKQLKAVSTLAEKGYARAPQVLELERAVAQIEGRRLEMQTAILRARQDISRTERNIVELDDKLRNDTAQSLRDSQLRLDAINQRLATTERLIYDSEITAPQLLATRTRSQTVEPVYSILRNGPSGAQEMTVSETTPVLPGDVVKVQIPFDSEIGTTVGAAPEPPAAVAPPKTAEAAPPPRPAQQRSVRR